MTEPLLDVLRQIAAVAALAGLACACAAAPQPAAHLWKSVPDDVYLQEVGSRILTQAPVTSIASDGEAVYAVTGGKIGRLDGGKLAEGAGAPTGVTRLLSVGGSIWALAPSGTYRLAKAEWKQVDSRPFVDLCLHLGKVYAATTDALFRLEGDRFVAAKPEGGYLSHDDTLIMDDGSQVLADPVEIGPITRIASYSGTLYILQPGRIGLIEGRTFRPDTIDWGGLPSPNTRDLLAAGSRLLIATERGVGVLRGMAMGSIRGKDGLPVDDTTCLAQGFDGDLWIGTTRGAIRSTGSRFQYFGAENWLPNGRVNGIAVVGQTVYAATDGGIGIISYQPCTLERKAEFFERQLDLWGFRRLGFISPLYWGGDQERWIREISDNDGGYTAHYLAAMSFKYAVTGDEKARKEALEAFNAMNWLLTITGKPGFIARSIWSNKGDKGERANRGSGGLPAKWYPTPDGNFAWKGDTSSDEVNGHMYAVELFHDLAAKGKEKDRARDHITAITSHIIEHGWVLQDMDGKATRWGRWDPDYLLKPYGFESRGLNGMEAQTYAQTAYALTGDEKFQKGLEQLMKWGYHTFTLRQRLTFPPDNVVPWDDELAFRCYVPLLRSVKDPDLKAIYLRSLERSYEILRVQRFPWFNFIYGGLTGNDCEAPEAVQQLRDLSLDLVEHTYTNSHRADLDPLSGYPSYEGTTRALSSRETGAAWDCTVSLQMDGGRGGRGVNPPIRWLEAYWMGRYFGMIEAPSGRGAKLIDPDTVMPRPHGADPYAGPARPAP